MIPGIFILRRTAESWKGLRSRNVSVVPELLYWTGGGRGGELYEERETEGDESGGVDDRDLDFADRDLLPPVEEFKSPLSLLSRLSR